MTKGRNVPQQGPRYITGLLAAAEMAMGRGSRGLIHVEIRHDSYCSLLNGRGPCDCSPEVHTGPEVQRRYEGGQV